MGKSLAEVAKSVLMKENYPSVDPSSQDPWKDAQSKTALAQTLRPGSKSPEADPKHNEAQDLGGATPTETPKDNLGAKAAVKGEDKSKPKQGSKPAEPAKKVEAMAEDTENESPVVAEEKDEDKKDDKKMPPWLKKKDDEGKKEDKEDDDKEDKDDKKDKECMEEDFEISEELEQFISNMIAEGASEEEIAAAIDENFEVVEEDTETVAESDIPVPTIDMSEDVDALFAGEELSEDFKAKAKTIFEAAVKKRLAEELKVLEESYEATLNEEIEKIQETFSEDVDNYLNYVVEQWTSDNEVAIEAGLRTELTEDFISGLRNLFAEHYIDVPQDKVDVLGEMGAKVEALEAKLNEEIERNVELNKMLSESKTNEILNDACDGLTDTQAEKLRALVEGIQFTSTDEYAQKVSILKENYFSTKVGGDNQVLDEVESVSDGKSAINEELTGPMSAYVKTLGRTLPNK